LSEELVPFKLQSLSPGHQTIHSYVCETEQPKEPLSPSATECQRDLQDGSRDLAQDLNRAEEAKKISQNLTACERELKKSKEEYQSLKDQVLVGDNILSQNLTDCRNELGRKEEEVKVLRLALREVLRREKEGISGLEGELEKTKELLRERDEMISSLQRELEASRKTTALPATTEATRTLEQPLKPQEQAADFLIPNMTFAIKESDYEGDDENGEAKSNVVKAGGLRWRASFWVSDIFWTRFLLQAESDEGSPSPWTVTVQSLTVKVLRKGGEGGAPLTYRLEGATFSSEKGVVGMLSGWEWSDLTEPSTGFVDPQGTLHLEVSFEGAAMSPSPPPQRPTVWEAEATLQLREFTSSLREDGDTIFSPSVHVGGVEWRVWVGRLIGDYDFSLQCNPEERSDWSLRVDWTISLLSAEGGGGNQERKGDGEEVSRGSPLTYGLSIPDASIARFLTGDTASVGVKIRVHH
ncbi:unnamed protein product, partial [Cyprideis torosa]